MTLLSIPELLKLGGAYRAFSMGDIDAGIHLVLPVRDVDTDEWSNRVFQDLIDQDFYNIDYPPGYTSEDPKQYSQDELPALYMDAIVQWTKRHDIQIGQ